MPVNLEFENNLWAMADKLRGNIQPGDYKDVVLGLIFLKYISDSFEFEINKKYLYWLIYPTLITLAIFRGPTIQRKLLSLFILLQWIM